MRKKCLIYGAGTGGATRYAVAFLKENGIGIVDHPTPDATHLLLDVPSFNAEGNLRSGALPASLLETVPEDITVIGGNLDHPELTGYTCIDLLKDPVYLAENARITAHCAMKVAASKMTRTFDDTQVLVIGWGRIGKCLAKLLSACGAKVTVAARKETVRAVLKALGYGCGTPEELASQLGRFHVIYNTAPAPVYAEAQLNVCKNSILIDLASQKGLDSGQTVWARGLPGIHAPESSGILIGRTILQKLKEEGL